MLNVLIINLKWNDIGLIKYWFSFDKIMIK